MDVKVNINEYVKVKLTELGISILKEKRNKQNKEFEALGLKGFGEYIPDLDEEGYTKFQLWDLMRMFGDSLSNGTEIPFETTVIMTKGEKVSKKDT